MVIFNSYVKLPEGSEYVPIPWTSIRPLEDLGAPSQPPLNRKCLNYTNHTVMPEAPVETWGFTIQNEELIIKNSNVDAKIYHEKWEDIGNIYLSIYLSNLN